jgi:DNA-binding GntR family transcriptional regulator
MKPAQNHRNDNAGKALDGDRDIAPGEPLHAWIARTLRERIANGIYAVGKQIPAEDRLSEEFAVSRSTIRQALRQLQSDRLIESRKGSGSIVLSGSIANTEILHATSIDELLAFSRGRQFHFQSIGIDFIGHDLAAKAGVPSGSDWLILKGYGTSEGHDMPDCWAEYYVNKHFAGIGRLLANPVVSPIFPLIEKRFGVRVVEVDQEMSAAVMSPAEASVLHVQPGTAAIAVHRVYTTSTGEVALITVAIYPAHRFKHSIKLRRI